MKKLFVQIESGVVKESMYNVYRHHQILKESRFLVKINFFFLGKTQKSMSWPLFSTILIENHTRKAIC